MNEDRKKISAGLLLAAITVFHLALTKVWLAADNSYLKIDAWEHYRHSLEIFKSLASASFLNLRFSDLQTVNWHGILVGMVSAPFYFIFGAAQDTAVMINSCIFFPILTVSTYFLAKRISGSRRAGILAAAILGFYPIVFNNLRMFMLDLPLAAMVAASLNFLIASEEFGIRKNSLLFGLTAGLGLLVKFNYAVFLIGPFFITAYRALRKPSSKKNLALLTLVAVSTCSLFYLAKTGEIWRHIYASSNLRIFQSTGSLLPAGFAGRKAIVASRFLESLIGYGLSLPLFLALVAALVFLRKRLDARLYWLMGLPLAIFLFLLSIDPGCILRYYIPALPVAAAVTAAGLWLIPRKSIRRRVFCLIIFLGMLQFFAVSFGIPFLPAEIIIGPRTHPSPFNLVVLEQNMTVPPFSADRKSHPGSADWRVKDVLKAVLENRSPARRAKVVSLSNIPELFEGLDYEILKNREMIDVIPASIITVEPEYSGRRAGIDSILLNADFLIATDSVNTAWEKFLTRRNDWGAALEKARGIFREHQDRFQLIKTYPLPDGTRLLLFRNAGLDRSGRMISSDRLRVVFEAGSVRIFSGNSEITKGLGLYTSFFCMQHWRDSQEAVWESRQSSPSEILATGRWLAVPIVQNWQIRLDAAGELEWKVKTTIEGDIRLYGQECKLMLSDRYRAWQIAGEKEGSFPQRFLPDSWESLGSSDQTRTVRVIKSPDGLPAVEIESLSGNFRCVVDNSDRQFFSRVIGFSRRSRNAVLPPLNDEAFRIRIRND